jgi:hypothetical protein
MRNSSVVDGTVKTIKRGPPGYGVRRLAAAFTRTAASRRPESGSKLPHSIPRGSQMTYPFIIITRRHKATKRINDEIRPRKNEYIVF